MTKEQQDYIEQNIDLIENNEWKKFFKDAPSGTGGVLYTATIDFINYIEEIPEKSFYKSKIEDITIPNNVTRIGHSAFYYCSNLTNIDIPDSVTSIGFYAFGYCSGLTSVTIGNSVPNIDDKAFLSCMELSSVSIGKNVHRIGRNAFYNCVKLSHINFKGTIEQWKDVFIEKDCWVYVPARTIKCIDGLTKLRH